MANVKTITATTTESYVEFNATYSFIWFRNYGENDCYICAHSGIVANADDVILLKAGEVAMLILSQTPAQSKAYIKAADGSNTVEVHAQNSAFCPFKVKAKGGDETEVVSLTATENKTYTAPSGTAYSPVTVNVPTATLGTKTITQDGTYNASSDNLDGYSSVVVDTSYKYVIPDTYEELDYVVCPSWTSQAYFQVPFKLTRGDYIITKSEIASDWNKDSTLRYFIGDSSVWALGYQNSKVIMWIGSITLYNITGDPRDYTDGTAYQEIIKNTGGSDATNNTYIGCYRSGQYHFKGKIFRTTQYRAVLSSDNIPIMSALYDLIPCKRKSDNVVGMYDAVNEIFYTSVSATAFAAPSE